MRVLIMSEASYQKVERALKHGLGNDIGLGWSGRQFDEALAIVQAAAEVPEPCGVTGCPEMIPADREYCPRHADQLERVEAMQAAG